MRRCLIAALAACVCGCATVQTEEDLMREAAANGDPVAQTWLGDSYGYGKNGFEIDRTEAAKWWRLAADQAYAPAMSNLGECYRMGEGVERNPVEAVKWYRLGAELGDARSQCFLGGAYAVGLGVEENRDEATRWWRIAADNGDRMAAEILWKLRIPREAPAETPAE